VKLDMVAWLGFKCVYKAYRNLIDFIQADAHQPLLIQLLCEQMSCKREDIVDFELCLADTQPAVSTFSLLV
jgi:aspartyl aminopeptidase